MGFDEDLVVLPDGWTFEWSFLDYVCNTALRCSICWDYLEEPRREPTCTNMFCRPCIERAFRGEDPPQEQLSRCPMCRTVVGLSSEIDPEEVLTPAIHFIQHFLNLLRVKCCYTPAGCVAPPMPLTEVREHELTCDSNHANQS